MEYYDGNKLTEEINPVMRDVNWSIFTSFLFFYVFCMCVFLPYCWNDYFFMCVFYAAAVQRRHIQMWDAALSNLPPPQPG
jgi:hypothetical protein